MIGLRKWHLYLGLIFSPFLLLQAVTGFILRTGKMSVLHVHDWQWIVKQFAYLLAIALAFLAVAGAMLFIDTQVRQHRRKAKRQQQPAAPAQPAPTAPPQQQPPPAQN